MVKALYFVDRMLKGGIQSLVIDWVSRFDKNKIQVDFLLLDDGKTYPLEENLKKIGCNVYKLNGIWIRKPWDYIKYEKALKIFFENHNDYKVLHMHSSGKNYLVLKMARKYNIPIRIAHSHNTGFQTTNKLKGIIGKFLNKKIVKYATDYYACSTEAGIWMYGKKACKTTKFKLIPNSINLEKFKFNMKKRDEIRKKLNIKENDILIGNVARLESAKNQLFLIDVFKSIKENNKNYKLIIIGAGSLESEIKEKINEYCLQDDVIMMGFIKNVYDYYQAMDMFILTSLYEGFPVSAVEAQTSGLPCILSNNITQEAKLNNNVKFIDLSVNAKEWGNIILQYSKEREKEISAKIINDFDINNVVLSLQKEYSK